MASLLATAALNPAFRLLPPDTFAEVDLALTYWLSNPLLPAGRVAATQQLLTSRHYSSGDKQALILRLKKRVQELRKGLRYEHDGYHCLLDLLQHELVRPEERNEAKPYLIQLRGAETEWEYTRLEEVIRRRIDAAFQHAA